MSPRHPWIQLPAALGLLALASACGGNVVPFQLIFPSQETFLVATTGRVDVYVPQELTADEICRNLSAGLPAGQSAEENTGEIDVCDLDGSSLETVPVGRQVFFADVVGGLDRVSILKGCTVADVYADTVDPVKIQLSTLPTYPEDPDVICADTDAKCEDKQPCLAGE